MKVNKKAAMGISLVIGTVMFATTAFAEVTSKSGYEQLKDAFKYTAENCSSKFKNYTINTSTAIKDNGKIVDQEDRISKYDISKNSKEETSLATDKNNVKTQDYYYSDVSSDISCNSKDGIYKETDYSNPRKTMRIFSNPFKKKGEADIEKIVDAVVGNLKDYVVVNQKTDGSRELSGSVSEAQIPAVANALVSYKVKNRFSNENIDEKYRTLGIVDDIYVKQVKANITLNKEGLLQTVICTSVLSGKDEQGKVHELTFEVLAKLVDVNATKVNKPDLTGKKVDKDTEQVANSILDNPQMYLGTYKNDILVIKDNKFQKIGERVVEITSIDNKNICGKYHEEYTKGNDEYSKNAKQFKFDANFEKELQNNASFESTDNAEINVSGNIYIDIHSGGICLSFNRTNTQNILENSQYRRVFN